MRQCDRLTSAAIRVYRKHQRWQNYAGMEETMATQDTTFTSEEVCNQAKGNVNAFALGTIAIFKKQGESAEEFFTTLGRVFAPSWDEIKGKGALGAARPAALNMVSGGANLESLSGDEHQAQVVVSGWPRAEDLQVMQLDRSDLEPFWAIYRPIADHLGLGFQVETHGDRVTLTFIQR